MIELTVPHEDNIDAAQISKDERYANLLTECEENGWVAKHFPIEVAMGLLETGWKFYILGET